MDRLPQEFAVGLVEAHQHRLGALDGFVARYAIVGAEEDLAVGGPGVADGKVFFGTNNGIPRDKAVKGTKAVLMCFNEADGKFLWQAVHEIPDDGIFTQSRLYGLLSAPC